MKPILFILALFLFISCKKKTFEHTATFSTGSCELCAYADSLQGTYTGPVTGAYYWSQQPASMAITLNTFT